MYHINKIDLHIHTTFSDGRCNPEEVIRIANLKRLKIVSITDHYSEFKRLTNRMTKKRFNEYMNTLEGNNIFRGVEAEILSDGSVSISKRNAELCDIIIGGLHSFQNRFFWRDPRPIWNIKRFMKDLNCVLIKAIETGLIDILAHPTWLPWSIRNKTKDLVTSDWIQNLLKAAKNNGVAIEINGAWHVPDDNFILQCINQGVKISIGSDAHTCSKIGNINYPVEVLKRTNVPNKYIFIPKIK